MHARPMTGAPRRLRHKVLLLGGALALLLAGAPAPAAAQSGNQFIADFLTVDGGKRMIGFTGGMQTSPDFERDRRGFGIQAKQVLSKWFGMYLLGQSLNSPLQDGGNEFDVDFGIDLFLVRAGPVALALQTFAGMHNLKADEGEEVLLQYGAGGGVYVAMGKHLVLGLTGTRNQVDTIEGSRTSLLLQLLMR